MTELMVVPWKRYGKARLYVKTPQGEQAGWLDQKSNQVVIEHDELCADFEDALHAYGVASLPNAEDAPSEVHHVLPPEPEAPTPIEATDVLDSPGSSQPPPERPWHDLALNEPGEGVRSRAKDLQHAKPVRNRVARVFGKDTEDPPGGLEL
jgi:hypothetical protein